jgi:hypothetical protein
MIESSRSSLGINAFNSGIVIYWEPKKKKKNKEEHHDEGFDR